MLRNSPASFVAPKVRRHNMHKPFIYMYLHSSWYSESSRSCLSKLFTFYDIGANVPRFGGDKMVLEM